MFGRFFAASEEDPQPELDPEPAILSDTRSGKVTDETTEQGAKQHSEEKKLKAARDKHDLEALQEEIAREKETVAELDENERQLRDEARGI